MSRYAACSTFAYSSTNTHCAAALTHMLSSARVIPVLPLLLLPLPLLPLMLLLPVAAGAVSGEPSALPQEVNTMAA